MKYLIGWLIGVGTAWAALAIWQRVPEFPDIDHGAEEADDLHRIVYHGERPSCDCRYRSRNVHGTGCPLAVYRVDSVWEDEHGISISGRLGRMQP